MKNKNILVTGGTGLIGSLLVEKLSKGNHVKCLVLKNNDIRFLDELGVKTVYGDITDKKSLNPAIKNIDYVFHLAAAFKKDLPENPSEDIYFKVNVSGTKNLLEVCKENEIERMIHFGAVGVYGFTTRNKPINENSPYNPSNAYERSKCEGEKIALKFNELGLPVTIIEPTVVYGPGEKTAILKLFKSIKNRSFKMIGNGKNKRDFVFVEDVVNGAILASQAKNAIGQKYIIGGERPFTFSEIVKIIADTFNVPTSKIKIPYGFARFGALTIELASKLLGNKPPITISSVDFLARNCFYDISKAKREIGYKPKIPLKSGVEITAKWYESNGLL